MKGGGKALPVGLGQKIEVAGRQLATPAVIAARALAKSLGVDIRHGGKERSAVAAAAVKSGGRKGGAAKAGKKRPK